MEKNKFVESNLSRRFKSKGVIWEIVGFTEIGDEFITARTKSKNRKISWTYSENPLRLEFMNGIDIPLLPISIEDSLNYFSKEVVEKSWI